MNSAFTVQRSDFLEILAGFRADAKDVADAHKRRDLYDQARLERRRLHLRARRRAVDPRHRVDDLQIHRHRQLDADRLLAVELHEDRRFGDDVIRVVPQDLDVDVQLLVRPRVHEMERVAVTVEILHLPLVEDRPLDVLFGAELVVPLLAGADVPHLGLDEPPLIARGEMLQVEDPEQLILELDQHASLQPGRLDGTHRYGRARTVGPNLTMLARHATILPCPATRCESYDPTHSPARPLRHLRLRGRPGPHGTHAYRRRSARGTEPRGPAGPGAGRGRGDAGPVGRRRQGDPERDEHLVPPGRADAELADDLRPAVSLLLRRPGRDAPQQGGAK